MSDICSESDCVVKNTEACVLCCRNNKYSDNYNNGYNIECESLSCVNRTRFKCIVHKGKGKVKRCKDETIGW